ncbi:MFS transporter [Pusillimonas sp. ANT_WB101]|uniref:MFS transporter n=1 Tax=Pusillimonas sp. ANT_WB101 TaxID=2597356 RepID=UPI0011F05038|nr:MFS transporter [Pusillimonas sp. ANT_WB101]KAA0911423.1 MFS transporter [Pusillimonas sp. ANT_WB101]
MNLKIFIIIMTTSGVMSDAILIPFYPQFFELRFGTDSAMHVGAYVAAISIAVMSALPFWARIARRIELLHLLIWTQLSAGTFGLLSNWAPNVTWYWMLSMLMFICKSSYLLMYPYLMRLTLKKNHAQVIGTLSVVVHFGAVCGAVVGGSVLQIWGPTASIMAMVAGDFFQMTVCAHLIHSSKIVRFKSQQDSDGTETISPLFKLDAWRVHLPILRLALVMLIFDFGCFVIRPFFSTHWQALTGYESELTSGVVFAIPGAMAITALCVHTWAHKRFGRLPDHRLGNLLLGIAGFLLQAAPNPTLVVVGRCVYGWAIFHIIVKLEVNLFRLSTPERYARDYAVTNFFQNLGTLLASFAAGAIVDSFGLYMPFLVGALAFVLTAVLDRLILKVPSAGHIDGADHPAPTTELEACVRVR